MIKLHRCGCEGGDGTAPYEVVLDQSYTVRTFIEAILKERGTEWGIIEIIKGNDVFDFPSYAYRYGELTSKMDKCFLDETVISVKASGGWSRMDYLIKT